MDSLTVTLNLTPATREFINQELSGGKYQNPATLLEGLLTSAVDKKKAVAKVEALLQEAVQSGEPTLVTPQSREEVRQELARFLQMRNGANHEDGNQ